MYYVCIPFQTRQAAIAEASALIKQFDGVNVEDSEYQFIWSADNPDIPVSNPPVGSSV